MADVPLTGRADLHLHSTASDGLWSPAELAQAVRAAGISAAAITDHDTTAGFAEFAASAEALGVQPIAGAEIAAAHAGEEVHLLAYFPEPPLGPFSALLRRLSAERRGRAEEMLRRLAARGIAVPDADEILAHPQVGRPHIARALVRLGLARDTGDAFRRYLTPGMPAYVERYRPPAEEAIALAGQEGGLVALAHPGHYALDHLAGLAAAGLAAVEVNHPSAGRAQRQALRRSAGEQDLLITGGSDCHGVPGTRPGAAALGRADARRFLQRLFA